MTVLYRRVPAAPPGSSIMKSSSVGGEMCSLGRNDDDDDDDKKRRSSFGAKMAAIVGLGKKSQSTSQLDPMGETARNTPPGITPATTPADHAPLCSSGEGKKKKPVRLAIQRSVETGLAVEMKSRMTRQPSKETTDENEKPGKYVTNLLTRTSLTSTVMLVLVITQYSSYGW